MKVERWRIKFEGDICNCRVAFANESSLLLRILSKTTYMLPELI